MNKGNCSYKEVGYVKNRHPRFKYMSGCGLEVVQMDHKVWNGVEHVIRPLEGKCMKCKKTISIDLAID